MKTTFLSILVGFAVVCLTAYGFITSDATVVDDGCEVIIHTPCAVVDETSGPDFNFMYVVEPRFLSCVLMETVESTARIDDIYPWNNSGEISEYLNITISTYNVEKSLERSATSSGAELSSEQLALLNEFDYSTNFYITGNVLMHDANSESGATYKDTLVRYFSILPDKPVLYADDMQVLIEHLQSNSRDAIRIAREDAIQPGKISFMVTEEGGIENVSLLSSCGYTSIDERLIEIVKEIPNQWTPARNAKREVVQQQLVLHFGGSMGC